MPVNMSAVHSEEDMRKMELAASPPGPKAEGDVSRRSDGDSTLSKTSDTTSDSDATLEGGDSNGNDVNCDDNHFLAHLMNVFWALHQAKPTNLFLTPMCQPGEAPLSKYSFWKLC